MIMLKAVVVILSNILFMVYFTSLRRKDTLFRRNYQGKRKKNF